MDTFSKQIIRGGTMNRLNSMTLTLLSAAFIILSPYSGNADNIGLQDFDRNACYSTCPCGVRGMEASCNECIQECDRKFWADFDKETSEEKVGSMDDDAN